MEKRKIDETLKGLLIGIILFEVVCVVAGVWFVDSVLKYLIGILVGTLLACGSAVHMWWALNRNFDRNGFDERAVQAYAIRSNIIRYAVVLFVFLIVCLTDFAYPLAAFLGIMGLKAGAYLQPVLNRIRK